MAGDAGEPTSSVIRRPILLRTWQRWTCLVFGVAAGGGGTAAVFVTKNQVGSTGLLLAGGLGLLMALTGRVPDRIGREGVGYEAVEAPAARTLNDLLADEDLPREFKAAVAQTMQVVDNEVVEPHNLNRYLLSPAPSWATLERRAIAVLYEHSILSSIESMALPAGAQLVTGLNAAAITGGYPRPDAAIVPGDSRKRDPARCVAIEIKSNVPLLHLVLAPIDALLSAGFGAVVLITPHAFAPVPELPANVRHVRHGAIQHEGGYVVEGGDELLHLQTEIEDLWQQINKPADGELSR